MREESVWEDIVFIENVSLRFSIIAHESTEISEKEQLFVGVRFVERINLLFATLIEFNAVSVANANINQSI